MFGEEYLSPKKTDWKEGLIEICIQQYEIEAVQQKRYYNVIIEISIFAQSDLNSAQQTSEVTSAKNSTVVSIQQPPSPIMSASPDPQTQYSPISMHQDSKGQTQSNESLKVGI